MSEPVIRVEGLGKRYAIGEAERYLALRDVLSRAFKAPLRLWRRRPREQIWALKDVYFEVGQGEVVGIIGRNGAGKTTLLKVLSRITRPTEGFAQVRGRIGSLLEVGTGFHPELTGRENVFLSGAILGMSKEEIRRKFDEIVAFAEVENFIDTPLKHYSSGMEMRLAFAVAAHLEPEILFIDEVLAVGDIAFQKKCLGKMGDVAKHGRTIVFVSHNLAAITSLCSRAIYLSKGHVELDGDTSSVTEGYLSELDATSFDTSIAMRSDRQGDGRVRFVGLHLEDPSGRKTFSPQSGQDCVLVLRYECPDGLPKRNVVVSFAVRDYLGVFLLHHRTNFNNQNFQEIPPAGQFMCRIPELPLVPGRYALNIFVGINEEPCDLIENVAQFEVEGGDFFGTGQQGMPSLCRLLIKCDWRLGSVTPGTLSGLPQPVERAAITR